MCEPLDGTRLAAREDRNRESHGQSQQGEFARSQGRTPPGRQVCDSALNNYGRVGGLPCPVRLLIFDEKADQWRADALGFVAGGDPVHTPNLDALAARPKPAPESPRPSAKPPGAGPKPPD